jgi:hypothetical protein
MRAMARHDALIAEKRRNLQLETLYDLAIALHAQRPEQELVDELLQRVCAVLDPAAAVAVTRDAYGGARGSASVGWLDDLPTGDALLAAPVWRELLTEGHILARSNGVLAGRPYEQLLAAPLAYRGVFLGYVAVLDKEVRGDPDHSFTPDDRRFLDSVASLAAWRPSASGWKRRTRPSRGGSPRRSPAAGSWPTHRPCAGCWKWWSGWRPGASTSWCEARAARARSWWRRCFTTSREGRAR